MRPNLKWKSREKNRKKIHSHRSKYLAKQKKITNFVLAKPRWRNGRRARFRCECCEACRFESCSGHRKSEITNWSLNSYLAFILFYVHITCKWCQPKSAVHSPLEPFFTSCTTLQASIRSCSENPNNWTCRDFRQVAVLFILSFIEHLVELGL